MAYYSEATTETFGMIMGAAQGASDVLRMTKNAKNKSGYLNRSSIMKASKDLVMSFPVICPESVAPDTASMIVKAIERNCVTTLQLLFSAANLRGMDGMDVIQQWHKNIDGDVNMDDYLDVVDSISIAFESTDILSTLEAMADKYAGEMVQEVAAYSNQTYPTENFSESSLMQYTVTEGYSGVLRVNQRPDPMVLNEKLTPSTNAMGYPIMNSDGMIQNIGGIVPGYGRLAYVDYDTWKAAVEDKKQEAAKKQNAAQEDYWNAMLQNAEDQMNQTAMRDYEQHRSNMEKEKLEREKFEHLQSREKEEDNYRKKRDEIIDKLNDDKFGLDKAKFAHQQQQDELRNLDNQVGFFHKQLVPSDVKKINEMVPSMIIVRFNAMDEDSESYTGPNYQQFIAGVKARLISVPSMEIIEAIRATEKSKVNLTNLVRATTKEISFCRDFIMGIEQAKIDAKRNSKLSKVSPIWRSLQWRSSKSVMNRLRRRKANDAGAITTLVLTSEEVNYMKSEYKIDLNIVSKAKSIMEDYNLMCLCVVDEEVEVARFLFDGEKFYQDYAFSALERETGDSSYKKVINLISKISR